jgi:hypothetical protein
MARGHETAPHQQAEQMAAPTSPASPLKKPLPTGSRPQMANQCALSGGPDDGEFGVKTRHFSRLR